MQESSIAPICCECGEQTKYAGNRLFFFACEKCNLTYVIPHPSKVTKNDLICDCCQSPFFILPVPNDKRQPNRNNPRIETRSFVVCSNPECPKLEVTQIPPVAGYVITYTCNYNCGQISLLYNNSSILSLLYVINSMEARTTPLENYIPIYRWAKQVVNQYTQKALLKRLGLPE